MDTPHTCRDLMAGLMATTERPEQIPGPPFHPPIQNALSGLGNACRFFTAASDGVPCISQQLPTHLCVFAAVYNSATLAIHTSANYSLDEKFPKPFPPFEMMHISHNYPGWTPFCISTRMIFTLLRYIIVKLGRCAYASVCVCREGGGEVGRRVTHQQLVCKVCAEHSRQLVIYNPSLRMELSARLCKP